MGKEYAVRRDPELFKIDDILERLRIFTSEVSKCKQTTKNLNHRHLSLLLYIMQSKAVYRHDFTKYLVRLDQNINNNKFKCSILQL